MMGRQSRQTAMIFVDIESLIPETHLLRKIERMVSFDFIYDLLAPYYPETGRPSVDPVSMFKMLLIGYLYGIKSERRLVEEVQLNIAYRSHSSRPAGRTQFESKRFCGICLPRSRVKKRGWCLRTPPPQRVFSKSLFFPLKNGVFQERNAALT